ncbi:MAG: tyrosine-type recombinase/integrase, partial [Bryobacteraceae bacterium]
MQALRVALTETLAYWTVVGDDWRPVSAADAYLRHLRLGADRAEGTTRSYAGDLACYLTWCEQTGRDLLSGANALAMFVAMLKTTPVTRDGAAKGRLRSPRRINHLLVAVRELYK